ncbi:hypothetical protein [Streptomyces sp. NBC_00878]|uniref:hypothetical protein n=1 Tax=Streptomyces sp. NBC_00878 TaxID=2975854 RepID=UPI0022520E28|nr:hypothetical protein [Streptomyces sp. NBC_00878]MCX4911247.1 hypothetical protein [Streptomyces sp. NBC_00878]
MIGPSLDSDLWVRRFHPGPPDATRLVCFPTAIEDTESRRKRLIRNLELVETPDREFLRDVNERRAELLTQKESLQQ